MSRIRRLSMRGIRNFGDDEECVIHFSRPITLILGPNGTGKTTIIEALKYATSGEFPPGSDKGKFFVHDPYLARTLMTRAVVKAEVINDDGNKYTVSRTMECSKISTQPSAVRFKTLDSTITKENRATKKKESITARCADVDKELTSILGVSKPILNYVLFCHQEDFSWPFEDGKKLKEKFDEIFDSASYNKAVENIMKCAKEMQGELRTLKVEKESYKSVVNDVEEKESDLRKLKARLEESTEKINEINGKLRPIITEIKSLAQRDSTYKDLSLEKEKKEIEYTLSKHECEKLKEIIKEPFPGTLEELNDMITSYDKTLLERNKEKEELNEKLQNIIGEEVKVMKMLAEQRVTIGKLRQQVKDHEDKINDRNKALKTALNTWKLDISDSASEKEVSATMKRLQAKVKGLERENEEKRYNAESEEKALQEKIDNLRTKHSMIKSEIQLKEKELTKIQHESNSIRTQIQQISADQKKLKSIKLKLCEAKDEMDRLSKACDEESIREIIKNKIESKCDVENELNKLDKTIGALHQQSSLQAELELYRSSARDKEGKIKSLYEKHENDIKILLDGKTFPDKKLKDALDQIHQKSMNELRNLTQEIEIEQRNLNTLDAIVSHRTNEMEKKISQIEHDKRKISSVCSYENFDEVLLLESKKLKDLQDKRGMYAYQDAAYSEYMKKLKLPEPCCPLCHRDFPDKKKLQDLMQEMEEEIVNHPDRLRQCETEMKKQQLKYDNMLQLKPIVEKIIVFEETDLKKLREDLDDVKKRLQQSEKRIQELLESKTEPENKLNLYRKVIGDILIWDQCLTELQKLNSDINDCEDKLANAGVTDNRSMKELQNQQESLKNSLKNINDEIDALRERINAHKEEMQRAKETHNALLGEHLKIRSDEQKLSQLTDKQNELQMQNVTLTESLSDLEQELQVANQELDVEIQTLKMTKRENRLKDDTNRRLAIEQMRRVNDLEKMQDEIVAFANRNVTTALEESENRLAEYQRSVDDYSKDKSKLEKSISEIKDKISQHEIRKRELSDVIRLHKMQKTIDRLKQEVADLTQKLNAMNRDEIIEKMNRLQRQEEILLRDKNIIIGQKEELERTIDKNTKELEKDQYRLARKHYFNKFAELKVCEGGIADLILYAKVLDKALLAYHEERMESVNRIITRLWKHVYKGTDTSSIQIRTEQTHGVGSNRRTYNYKLVQVKHGQEIGMKGRCSAGQKVLASIIIRLALAETFCKECGVLALDEPTTNLDEENAHSLAEAIISIVELRAQYQRNFQLIVISHDEKFLFKLAELNYNRSFYELYRKPSGYSGVKRLCIDNRDNIMDQSSDEETDMENSESTSKTVRKKRPTQDDANIEMQQQRPTKRRYIFE